MARSPTFMGLKGYDLGFMGGLTTSPEFLGVFNNPNSSLLGFLVSSYEVGALCGALFQFLIGDKFGRKTNNFAGAVVVAVGAALQCSSYSLAQFLVGRLVSGFGLGTMTTVIPIWLTECATPKSRGRMMAMQLSNLIMGLIVANWLDYGMASYSGSIQWRFPEPTLPLRRRPVGTSKHRPGSSARRTPGHPEIVEEIKEIQYALAIEAEEAGSWSDCFKDNGISGWQRVLIAFSANFFQQLSGVNVMSSLGPYVFQESIGMSRYDALLVSGGLQVFYFLSSLIPWYAVDRVGRRRLFMIGSAGMGICMTLSAIFVGVGTRGLGYAAAVVLYLFQTFFTLGWQSNMWVYPSELLPLKLRLRGGALAVVSQWLFTFLVETCGLPLEAVDLLFADRNGTRPSLFKVAKDSANREYIAEIERQLQARAALRAEHEGIIGNEKGGAEMLEYKVNV
ncbi:hypothetical protein H2203_002972 [Taxawa tesnikishii (nom. ined.)]|nr:hypothetical protein H2203_002972 [Dothideales sp. JES 119]